MPSKRERKLISKNRSAHHEYFIDETFECGIELSGTEVKSIRERACQITDTFALIRGGECWLVGLHIHPYSHGGVWNRDPDRRRRLLLHRKEIDFLESCCWAWAAAKSSTTSARTWPSVTFSARSIVRSRNATADHPS